MSLDLWNAVGTYGTFFVIAATALAALVQLRHMRSSNQIAALSDLSKREGTPEFASALQFVFNRLHEKMKDPAFRYQVVHAAARTEENAVLIAKIMAVGSYYEEMGLLVKSGLIDRELLFDMQSPSIVTTWDALREVTAIRRERYAPSYENSEYLTVLAQDWLAKHPSGTYPTNVRRLDVPNVWHSAGEQYAAALATAV
jgi:hypothetical protein